MSVWCGIFGHWFIDRGGWYRTVLVCQRCGKKVEVSR